MKRRLPQPVKLRSRRSGALFHYYVAWVALTSSLMLMAGTCLHLALRSEQTDQRISQFIHALQQCERRLREDTEGAKLQVNSDSSLTVTRDDDVQVNWSADRGTLTRLEKRGGEMFHSDRFVFPAGSRISVETRDSATVLRFFEPSVFVRYSAAGNGGLNRNKSADEALPPTPTAAAAQPVTEIILYE